MKIRQLCACVVLALAAASSVASEILLKNVRLYDGSGKKPSRSDVRIQGDRIYSNREETDSPARRDCTGCTWASPGSRLY